MELSSKVPVRDERNKKQESLEVKVSPLMFLEFVNLVSYVPNPALKADIVDDHQDLVGKLKAEF